MDSSLFPLICCFSAELKKYCLFLQKEKSETIYSFRLLNSGLSAGSHYFKASRAVEKAMTYKCILASYDCCLDCEFWLQLIACEFPDEPAPDSLLNYLCRIQQCLSAALLIKGC